MTHWFLVKGIMHLKKGMMMMSRANLDELFIWILPI
jgi:hypothetical protein